MSRFVKNFWDCPYCDARGIGGDIDTCPKCGKTRGPEVKFYLPEQITYVSAPIEKGPDWLCPFCDSYNPHSANQCKHCGASKGDAKTYFDVLREQGRTPDLKNPSQEKSGRLPRGESGHRSISDGESYSEPRHDVGLDDLHGGTRRTESHVDAGNDAPYHSTAGKESYYSRTSSGSSPKPVSRHNSYYCGSYFDSRGSTETIQAENMTRLFIILALIASFILIVAVCLPKTKTITVARMSWAREIDIEENRLVNDSGWSVPSDAVEITYTSWEIHHYDSVLDHYETVTEEKSRQVQDGYDVSYSYHDLGNGYSEEIEHRTPRYRTEYYTETHTVPVYRDEPVYRTKYHYTIWRYVYDHTETTSGESVGVETSTPEWPSYQFVGDQREGARHESYIITCYDKNGKPVQYKTTLAIWTQMSPDRSYTVKISMGCITEIVN